MPAGWWDEHVLAAVDVRYRAEAVYGDTVTAQAGGDGEARLRHVLKREADGNVLAVARTDWLRDRGRQGRPRAGAG